MPRWRFSFMDCHLPEGDMPLYLKSTGTDRKERFSMSYEVTQQTSGNQDVKITVIDNPTKEDATQTNREGVDLAGLSNQGRDS